MKSPRFEQTFELALLPDVRDSCDAAVTFASCSLKSLGSLINYCTYHVDVVANSPYGLHLQVQAIQNLQLFIGLKFSPPEVGNGPGLINQQYRWRSVDLCCFHVCLSHFGDRYLELIQILLGGSRVLR